MFETFYPILFLVLFALFLAGLLVVLSIYIGKPYECGMTPIGNTKEPIPVKFYMVAILFILFDIEVVFLYPWAVIARKLEWFGFIEILVFIVILLVGYFYVLGKGALKWE